MHVPGLEACVYLTVWRKIREWEKKSKKQWVYLSEPSARGSLGRYTVLTGAAVWQRWKQAVFCELDLDDSLSLSLALRCRSGNRPAWCLVCLFVFFFFFKSADSHKGFSHLGIIVALRVYILMVKGKKKIIKSYFEDGRPSNQSVFRQCVFKWTFIYKYLFVIASFKKKKVFRFCIIIIYPSCIYIEKKILYFFSIYLLRKKKKQRCFFLSIVLKLHFLFLVLVL